MRGRTRSLRAAALVDGDINKHASRFHQPQHGALDELRSARAGHEHRADEHVNARQELEQMRFVRVKRMRAVHRDVEETHPLDVHFEDRHVGAEAIGHARGVDARRPAAEHDHAARQHARHPAEQHARAAAVLGEEIAADDD